MERKEAPEEGVEKRREEQGGAERSREGQGKARRGREEQGGAGRGGGRSREGQGKARRDREEQEGAGRSRERQGGAGRARRVTCQGHLDALILQCKLGPLVMRQGEHDPTASSLWQWNSTAIQWFHDISDGKHGDQQSKTSDDT